MKASLFSKIPGNIAYEKIFAFTSLFIFSVSAFAQEKDLWFKKGTIYNLDVKVFKDSDKDGFGDFKGLTQKLPYLDSLGISILWLAPFQPSPLKDDGYDVSDYYSVDTRVGSMQDFKEFIRLCKNYKMKVILDMVINHTSKEHPWFKNARSEKSSYYRNWYIWSEKEPENIHQGMVFPGFQESIWTYDSLAKAYYYHRFYSHQPDLNLQNSQVKQEIKNILKYWLEAGISGFRLDAAPFIIEVPDTKSDNFNRQHSLLSEFRTYLNSLDHNAILLGEANVPPKENHFYFGEKGEGMNMLFNFFVNQQLFYALASSRTKDIIKAIKKTQQIPEDASWAQFLRNHDEVDLGRLSKAKRNKVYQKFGPDKVMQLYNRGIRRRLAPMLENNTDFIKLAYHVLFSLPSTPVIRYGEEIGMGDNLSLQERESVRTPMQWNNFPNAGFSESEQLIRPVIDSGMFGYDHVNVLASQKDTASLYYTIKKLILLRRQCPELQYGKWEILSARSPTILLIAWNLGSKRILTSHNFNSKRQIVSLKGKKLQTEELNDIFSDQSLSADNKNVFKIELKGRQSRWFRY